MRKGQSILFALFFIIINITTFSRCSDKENIIEDHNTLPFGLEYYQSSQEVDSILGKAVENGYLKENAGVYKYEFPLKGKVLELNIEPFYVRDSLYKLDIRENVMKSIIRNESFNKQYEASKAILRSLKIEPTIYKEKKNAKYGNCLWSNNTESIELIGAYSFIIILSENKFSEELDRERSIQNSKDLKERLDRAEEQSERTRSGEPRINTQCFAATSEGAYKEMTKASVRKDRNKIQGMVLAGEIYVLEPNTKVDVIKRKFGKVQIRTSAGTLLWVDSNCISE